MSFLDMKINNKRIVFLSAVIASSIFNVLLYSSIGVEISMRIVWGSIGLSSVIFQAISIREYFKSKKIINLIFYLICTVGSIAGTVGTGWSQIQKISPIEVKEEIENNIQAIDKVFKTSKELNQWATIKLIKQKNSLKKEKKEIIVTEKKISSSLYGIADLLKVRNESIAFLFLIFSALILEMMVFGTASYEVIKEDIKKKRVRVSKITKELNSGQIMFTGEDKL